MNAGYGPGKNRYLALATRTFLLGSSGDSTLVANEHAGLHWGIPNIDVYVYVLSKSRQLNHPRRLNITIDTPMGLVNCKPHGPITLKTL